MTFWDELQDSFAEIGRGIGEWAPRIVSALIILIVGRWVAKIVRRFVRRLLDRPAVNGVLDKAGISGPLSSAGYNATELVATAVYVILLFVVFLMAAQALKIDAVVDLLQGLVAYLPLVLVAVFILVVTAAIGNFLADIVRPWSESRDIPWLTYVARYALIVFGVLTALDVLGVGQVSTRLFEFLVGAAAVAFAIAFGVGGIDTAKRWWARYLSPREG